VPDQIATQIQLEKGYVRAFTILESQLDLIRKVVQEFFIWIVFHFIFKPFNNVESIQVSSELATRKLLSYGDMMAIFPGKAKSLSPDCQEVINFAALTDFKQVQNAKESNTKPSPQQGK